MGRQAAELCGAWTRLLRLLLPVAAVALLALYSWRLRRAREDAEWEWEVARWAPHTGERRLAPGATHWFGSSLDWVALIPSPCARALPPSRCGSPPVRVPPAMLAPPPALLTD